MSVAADRCTFPLYFSAVLHVGMLKLSSTFFVRVTIMLSDFFFVIFRWWPRGAHILRLNHTGESRCFSFGARQSSG